MAATWAGSLPGPYTTSASPWRSFRWWSTLANPRSAHGNRRSSATTSSADTTPARSSSSSFVNRSSSTAERVGFEPTDPCGSTVFKTVAFVHSATVPASILPRRVRYAPVLHGEVPESGRSGLTANEVWVLSPPRVQIPPSPPTATAGPHPRAGRLLPPGLVRRFATTPCDDVHKGFPTTDVAFACRLLTPCCTNPHRTRARVPGLQAVTTE